MNFYLDNKEFYFVSPEMQISRFICACLIHFKFSNKLFLAMRMMKYSCYHWQEFRYKTAAFLFPLLQFLAIGFAEAVNIVNLGYIGKISDLVANYVALGCICEFDDEFINMYRTLRT
jgi:hypothetical protein